MGKAREEYHPYDRRDGTGRGRGIHKGGHGKGNLGDMQDEVKAAQDDMNEEDTTKKEEGAEEETKGEEKAQEKPAKEKPEEEEEKDEFANAMTLEQYLAEKKAPVARKEARKAEEVKKENLQRTENTKEKITTITSNLTNKDVYSIATGKQETAKLLGFQAPLEDFRERGDREDRGERRGRGRGGRGGRGGYGGRRQNQGLDMNEDSFPTL